MTQEDKNLLLKDLCARVPYGVKGIRDYADEVVTLHFIIPNCKCPKDKTGFIELEFTNLDCCPINKFKPYLRPMSSMTEEERTEYLSTKVKEYREAYPYAAVDTGYYEWFNTYKTYDWLNSYNFDYRGLIPTGLALEAPEDMYR